MSRASKIGLVLMCGGFLIWFVPTVRYYYPTWVALKAPLPLTSNGVLHETFRIRTAEHYSINLACQEVGQFREAWKDFLNWKNYPTLDCNISLHILYDGQEVHAAQLHPLRPASYSVGVTYWSMGDVELPHPGSYELLITNHTDMSVLRPTSPIVQIYLNGCYHKDVGSWSALGLLVGAPVFLIGFAVLLVRCFR